MDLDAYVAAHRGEWDRLEQLLRRAGRPGRLNGAEVDELVDLYQTYGDAPVRGPDARPTRRWSPGCPRWSPGRARP